MRAKKTRKLIDAIISSWLVVRRKKSECVTVTFCPAAMMRPRYTLLPSSDENVVRGTTTPSSANFDDDEEERLTRPPRIIYPHNPRFDRPPPPTWQRVALVLAIIIAAGLAVWLQNGFWIGAII
ncbi:hypothetical protein C8F04DRAFT_1258169 [Mycena alexandri]|uniref:Uncharacterized protein n=1 Tax=Mycena alexandri TaxID=1745969 RepID=A0AAD6SYC1_9AGAR|nr:hypothetical protein C8F04DRAFT_1258169 [Mycena alexandri]